MLVLVSICESFSSAGVGFSVKGQTAEPACASIVAMLFMFSTLLPLVLCQEVASLIGCSTKGQDPADGSIVCLDNIPPLHLP